jgi:predicted RNase H-like nuclease
VRVLGIDLAWGEGSAVRPANETGVVAVEQSGRIIDAGWTVGVDSTVSWMSQWASDDTLAMVDASLVVTNAGGQRPCEREVGRRYGRWKVSANSTNLASRWAAGTVLLSRLEQVGWRYDDGRCGPPFVGRRLSEVYPYTTIVGAPELGYSVERPRYKRSPRRMTRAVFQPLRALACDELIARIGRLCDADPPIDLRSHPVTALLLDEPSPLADGAYKHREDLVDAVLCAWTGLLWLAHGLDRCQVLGSDSCGEAAGGRVGTIIAPARASQRRGV